VVLQFAVADAGRGSTRRALARPGFTLRKLQVSMRTARGVISVPPPKTAVQWSEMRPVRALARVFRALRDSARGVTG
jgi:hypothetical protein